MSVLAPSHTIEEVVGPRRLNPMTDLSEVADLIEQAFFEDLDHEGRQVLRELRHLSRWAILLWLMRLIGPGFEEILSGFVWEENGHIVGNVSVNVISGMLAHWRISNVAVEPAHRRRGIAQHLMEATIDYVQQRAGKTIFLQVRDDNAAALRLYEGLGFQSITAETEMYLPAGFVVAALPQADNRVRAAHSGDSHPLYSLALAATPKPEQRLTPINRIDFETDWLLELSEKLTAFTSGSRTYRFVIDGKSGLAAYARLVTARGKNGIHRLSLLVHPAYQGQVEEALLRTTLSQLTGRTVPAEVQIRLNATKEPEIAALTACGFKKRRTLVTMELHV